MEECDEADGRAWGVRGLSWNDVESVGASRAAQVERVSQVKGKKGNRMEEGVEVGEARPRLSVQTKPTTHAPFAHEGIEA